MKSKIGLLIATVLFVATSTNAAPRKTIISVTTNPTNSTLNATANDANVQGWIDYIWIDVPSGTQTGTVSLVTSITGQTIASKTAMISDTVIRPLIMPTTSDGTSWQGTNGVACRYMVYGELLTFAVTNANSTNVVWKCTIGWDDGK